MSGTTGDVRAALAQIARLAETALGGPSIPGSGSPGPGVPGAGAPGASQAAVEMPSCVPKSLPRRLQAKAAATARRLNPMNAPFLAPHQGAATDVVMQPMFLTLITSKYWGASQRQLTVSFMETTPSELAARILSHMNAWGLTIGISFAQTNGTGQVRISREGSGYWSYIGTDVLHIPSSRPTMNLQGFTMTTPDSEYKRVVRHETGHTLGFPHEHMRRELIERIDPEKAYVYFQRTQGWSRQTVDQQVLTPLDENSIMGTPADETSIMCYQLPGNITRDGKPILGGLDINQTDYTFAGQMYPKGQPAQASVVAAAAGEPDEWDASEDVDVTTL